jgi:hypothetical protein
VGLYALGFECENNNDCVRVKKKGGQVLVFVISNGEWLAGWEVGGSPGELPNRKNLL